MAKLPATRAFDADLVSDLETRYCQGPDAGDRNVFWPGVSRWYALRVPPQREDQAEAWLLRRGVYAFHPVLSRQSTKHGRVREYQRRYLPGYVFARFPGEPLVHLVSGTPFILGALCRSSGHWGILRPQGLRAIYAMRKIDADSEEARRAVRRSQMLHPGDRAMFHTGPFAEFPCEVIEIKAEGGAKVRLQLFGREVLADAADGALTPLNKTD
ncbi:transcription termination/antitermination protein NusG [Seohaeicola nanhaiensis]|uniref:Transcription termination/antitermination protein NusG n=1 Tax=Seohaeicola nanhaiensis TaxID=1387282 RepID=A0ABV9KDR2_9RHOB